MHSFRGRRCPQRGFKALHGMPMAPHVCTCIDKIIKIRLHASHSHNVKIRDEDNCYLRLW